MQPNIQNVNKLLIVFSLSEGKKHGYEIIKEIEKKTGKKPSTSQVYPFLNKMYKNKLIKINETGERGKKIYSLTEKGEKYIETKFKMFSDIVESTISKDLTTCAHCGCRVYDGGHKEELENETLNFCCEHCANSYKDNMP